MTEVSSKAASPTPAASADAPQEAWLADECPGCHEFFAVLPVVDAENGQRYCTPCCLDETSERYWTAVWTA